MQLAIRYVPGVLLTDETGTHQYGKYFIDVLDDSGNPINGDNVVANYSQYEGSDFVIALTKTIPGQSVKIYDGVVSNNDGPMINYLITGFTPGTPAPPITPDLKIVSITVTKKANSAGHGGLVTVTATSSNLPLQYELDGGGTILNTGVDIPVEAGPHTIRVFDSSGNFVDGDFTVDKAGSILAVDPSKTVSGLVSRWNAAFNPVVFEYHRKDFDVTGIELYVTYQKPKITVNTVLTGLSLGDYIYLDCGLTNGLSTYKGAYKVLDFAQSFIIIDADYVAPDTVTGFANIDALRPYYKVLTKIKAVDPLTGLFKTVTSINRDINGVTRADISNYLQSILRAQPDKSDYTQVNYRDTGLAASYQISYAETWEGNDPEFTDIDTPFYVVYSAQQLQSYGGGNMFNFVTQPAGVQLAKWLTDFIEPAYSTGFPFDLPFIYSEQIAGRQLYSKITLLDYNRRPLGDADITTFLLNENGSYLLNQDGSKFIIARQQLVNTPIVEHVGLNRLLINQDFGPECWYINVQLFYDEVDGETTTAIPVTQPITTRIDRVCPTKWVYLRWIGLNGSWNYFRFNYNQTKTLDVQNPVLTKRYVTDWENDETIEQIISKDASQKLQLYADLLSQQDINGLQSIKYSPNVQMLMSKTPLKWQTIIVNSSTFTEYDTQLEYFDFGITFNLPSINIQTQ